MLQEKPPSSPSPELRLEYLAPLQDLQVMPYVLELGLPKTVVIPIPNTEGKVRVRPVYDVSKLDNHFVFLKEGTDDFQAFSQALNAIPLQDAKSEQSTWLLVENRPVMALQAKYQLTHVECEIALALLSVDANKAIPIDDEHLAAHIYRVRALLDHIVSTFKAPIVEKETKKSRARGMISLVASYLAKSEKAAVIAVQASGEVVSRTEFEAALRRAEEAEAAKGIVKNELVVAQTDIERAQISLRQAEEKKNNVLEETREVNRRAGDLNTQFIGLQTKLNNIQDELTALQTSGRAPDAKKIRELEFAKQALESQLEQFKKEAGKNAVFQMIPAILSGEINLTDGEMPDVVARLQKEGKLPVVPDSEQVNYLNILRIMQFDARKLIEAQEALKTARLNEGLERQKETEAKEALTNVSRQAEESKQRADTEMKARFASESVFQLLSERIAAMRNKKAYKNTADVLAAFSKIPGVEEKHIPLLKTTLEYLDHIAPDASQTKQLEAKASHQENLLRLISDLLSREEVPATLEIYKKMLAADPAFSHPFTDAESSLLEQLISLRKRPNTDLAEVERLQQELATLRQNGRPEDQRRILSLEQQLAEAGTLVSHRDELRSSLTNDESVKLFLDKDKREATVIKANLVSLLAKFNQFDLSALALEIPHASAKAMLLKGQIPTDINSVEYKLFIQRLVQKIGGIYPSLPKTFLTALNTILNNPSEEAQAFARQFMEFTVRHK